MIEAGIVFLFDRENADREHMFDISRQTARVEIVYTKGTNLSSESKEKITLTINKILKQEESETPCLFGCGM